MKAVESSGAANPPRDEDDALMLAVRAGNRQAFATLMERYEARVFGFSAKYLGHRALAEDACQETFIRLWQLRDKYVPSGRLQAYVMKVCLNRCRELSRSNRRRRGAMERFEGQAEQTQAVGVQESLLQTEKEKLVERSVAQLPAKWREAVLLRFFNGLSYRDMSDMLGRPEGTLRAHVHSGLSKLRPRLKEIAT